MQAAGAQKLLLTVPVRKPNRQDFNRVHPGAEYRENLAVVELKDDREVYLLLPEVARNLPGEFAMVTMYTAINGRASSSCGRSSFRELTARRMAWHTSAAEAAELAMTRWVRVKANMCLGAYEIFVAAATIPDPEWPEHYLQGTVARRASGTGSSMASITR